MKSRSEITSFVLHGQRIVRANVWTKCGHSSRTFNSAAEASFWIGRKIQKDEGET